ncbi:carbohydrate ABC transporter permease [uncultured Limimaricola sp.]|uniref:carbohydrate ABC transporter permease n=1 Tax=uncultured Limimaricola sp. TaxID=2211667 RepID=UPI0030FA8F4C
MDNIAGKKSALTWAVNIAVLALVALWVFPTLGLLISSFRTGDQISSSGWWRSMMPIEQNLTLRTAGAGEAELIDGLYTVSGNLFAIEGDEPLVISAFGTSSRDVGAHQPGDTVDMGDGEIITVEETGDYIYTSVEEMSGRGQRVFVTAEVAPEFTLQNYDNMLLNPNNIEGMSKAFFNTLTVSIPATIIPILVAAFAAYALAWMDFPGRALLIAAIVGLLVVPLQLALIPLLKLHNEIGIGKGYMGVWLAHTGFGLPLAIYILRNYMVGLPRDIIENAKVDGATDFQIFTKIILPLSFPALASFAIFQFLWTWNDLLVAMVFLIDSSGETTVMTKQIIELLGTRGGNWEILATAAFVSIAVPLVVFFAMQKYLVRGLLAGSVK